LVFLKQNSANNTIKSQNRGEFSDCRAVFTDLNCDASHTPGLSICAINLKNMKPSTLTAVTGGWLDERTGEESREVHIGELIDNKTGECVSDAFIGLE
jgi:hypothetical protein